MKTSFLSMLLLISSSAFSQKDNVDIQVDPATLLISYTEIDEADSVSKEILFDKALEWYAINNKSKDDVIRFQNKEAGKIIATGTFTEPINFIGGSAPSDCRVFYSINVDTKKGRVKIQLTDFTAKYYVDIAPSGICDAGWMDTPLESLIYMNCYPKAYADFFKRFNTRVHSILDSFSFYVQNTQENADDW